MDPVAGLVGIALMIALLLLGVPLAFSMGIVGFAGFAYFEGITTAVSLTIITSYTTLSSFTLAAIPLFVFMGITAFRAGVGKDLYAAINAWLGRLPGGLAMVTVAVCAAFGAVCGSSPVTAATVGSLALPEMKRFKYTERFSLGCLAASGTLGILIPPSIPMVIYGIITEQSIGRLFIAGIIPGIFTGFLFIVMIYVRAKLNPTLAPRGPSFSWKERLKLAPKIWSVAAIFLVVIGGIYSGFFTPTEAAAAGAFTAVIVSFAQKRFNWRRFLDSLKETTLLSSMILATFIGAMTMTAFMVMVGLPETATNFVLTLGTNRYVILSLILLVYAFLGCVMDVLGMLVFTLPIFFPIIMALKFDPIWFGIIVTVMSEVGLITPPVGMNCLVIKGLGNYSTTDVFGGVGWFLLVQMVALVIFIIYPEIVLFLPNLMYQ